MTQPKIGWYKVGDLVRFTKIPTSWIDKARYEGIWEVSSISPYNPTYVNLVKRVYGRRFNASAYQHRLEPVFTS